MNATDLELTILEDLLGDECKCELNHVDTECSIKVTHIITFCVGSGLICFNGAMNRTESMKIDNCAFCSCPASKCWSIRPV